MSMNAGAALWFLPFIVPITLWVAWTDMKWMKIKNLAVLALILVYGVIGPLGLPLATWAWGWVHLIVVLLVGFALSAAGWLGAGDAKFAAAMAPFIMLADLSLFLVLLGTVILASFITHRLFRSLPVAEAVAPGWESWRSRKFPLGLALGPALLFYLGLAAFYGTGSS
ncbi:MAG: prepilin peptidase [Roseinatronobacter sp.]